MTMPFMVSVTINRVYNEEHSFIGGAFLSGVSLYGMSLFMR